MFTETQLQYAQLSANVYGSKKEVRSELNTLQLPKDWAPIFIKPIVSSTGFMGQAYRNSVTGEVVISYSGTTTEEYADWYTGNLPAGAGLATPQVYEAAAFYLEVLKVEGVDPAKTSFTGHSLGGGLASLMAIYFDKEAIVFDQAPFKLSAATFTYLLYELQLSLNGYDLPAEFKDYDQLEYEERKLNVEQIAVKGEILEYLGWNTLKINDGSPIYIDPQAESVFGWSGATQATDLHSMSLLTGFMNSEAFLNASQDYKELLPRVFDGIYKDREPTYDVSTLLDLLVQRQIAGEGSLDALAADLAKIDVAEMRETNVLFSVYENGAIKELNLVAALVDVSLAGIYAQANGRNPKQGFTNQLNEVLTRAQGYIGFDAEALGEEAKRGVQALSQYILSVAPDRAFDANLLEHSRWGVQDGDAMDYAASEFDLRSDVVVALNGSNHIATGSGNDLVFGGDGADDITGGAGDDRLFGGAGNDTYRFNSDPLSLPTADSIYDSGGDGVIFFNDVRLSAGTRISENTWKDTTGKLTLTWMHAPAAGLVIKNLADGDTVYVESWINGQLGITLSGEIIAVDTSSLTTEADAFGELALNSGNDRLASLAGNDGLSGGVGDDYLDGGDDQDLIAGGAGNDTLFGGGGNDLIFDGARQLNLRPLDDVQRDAQGRTELDRFNEQIAVLGSAVTARGTNWFISYDSAGKLVVSAPGWVSSDTDALTGGDDVIDAGTGDDLVLSGEGDDIVTGGEGNDIIEGGEDDDILNGGKNDDILIGDGSSIPELLGAVSADASPNGNDILNGEDGNDRLYGYGGNDQLFGGEGNDILMGFGNPDAQEGAGQENDYLDGGAGDDKIEGGGGNDIIYGGSGADELAGDDQKVDIALHGNDLIDGGEGDDLIWGFGGADTLKGGAGNDTITGDYVGLPQWAQGDDVIDAGDGDDIVQGNGGNDLILGGTGNDLLGGGEGDDRLFGGEGTDELQAGAGDDVLDGGASDDRLYGEAGDDYLQGGEGTDELQGGDGNDVLHGDGARDLLYGQAGDDTLVGGEGDDALEGGSGNDTLDGGSGLDYLSGGEGDDVLRGGQENDDLYGGMGNDELDGGDGNDRLFGNEGNDYLRGGKGDDEVSGATGDDTLYGEDGADSLSGQDGNDVLHGEAGKDSLSGDAGNDMLFGGDGDDTLVGGAGNDLMEGGGGSNSYFLDRGFGSDTVRLTSGAQDQVVFRNGIGSSELIFARTGDDLRVQLIGSTDEVNLMGYFTAGNQSLIKTADGYSYSALSFANGALLGAATKGTDSGETLQGTDAPDRIYALAGNDTLYGGGGDDWLDGGAGDDVFHDGAGNDTLVGGTGNDTYYIGAFSGLDTIAQLGSANAGTDRIVLSQFTSQTIVNYQVSGGDLFISNYADNGPGSSVRLEGFLADGAPKHLVELGDGTSLTTMNFKKVSWYGTSGNDTYTGGLNPDSINGRSGNDVLYGGAGDDSISGDEGDDTLYGGIGNDSFSDDTGRDIVYGEAGDDVFNITRDSQVDRFIGGQGNDGYYMYHNFISSWQPPEADLSEIEEAVDGGIDTFYTNYYIVRLTSNIENVVVKSASFWYTNVPSQIVGNALNNDIRIEQASAAGDYSGRKYLLDGGAGDDTLVGRESDDTYVVDSAGDIIVESAAHSSNDTVRASFSYSIANRWELENIELTGESESTATGNSMNNKMNGRMSSAANTLVGGAGDDTYIVDENDIIVEAVGGGQDTRIVYGDLDVIAGNNIEIYRLAEGSYGTLRGNDEDNILYGSTEGGVLIGGGGDDSLYATAWVSNELFGGEGNDLLESSAKSATLSGGRGDDEIVTGSGNENIRYALGDGSDVIRSDSDFGDGTDVLNFSSEIRPEDVVWSRAGNDLQIAVGSGGDMLTVKDYWKLDNTGSESNGNNIDEFYFEYDQTRRRGGLQELSNVNLPTQAMADSSAQSAAEPKRVLYRGEMIPDATVSLEQEVSMSLPVFQSSAGSKKTVRRSPAYAPEFDRQRELRSLVESMSSFGGSGGAASLDMRDSQSQASFLHSALNSSFHSGSHIRYLER